MRDTFKYLQVLGQSLMLPVSVLPAAGLLLRFGEKDLLNMPAVREAGLAVFANLPLIFAVGVAIGFSGGQAVAALAAVVGQLIMLAVLKSLSPGMDTGVFSGIVMGITAAILYKQFYQIRLPEFLGFFAGKRFVPIITAVAGVVIALIFKIIWPGLQYAIDIVGHAAVSSSAGPALFAAGKRLLIPVGLHHVYYPAFLYEFGHYMTADGQSIKGDFYRYFAGDPTAGVFMASEFPIMMFGLPAAALAIYHNARPERKKSIAGFMASAALTSFLTGITEPIEFAFVFAAPQLFVFHVLMAGISGLVTSLLDVHLGFTFSASFIDYLLSYKYGHNQLLLWPIGLAIGILYFGVFHVVINKLNLKTPGREDETASEMEKFTAEDLAPKVLEALGGGTNIDALDACISRLRVTVKQPGLVKKYRLQALGAAGIMEMGRNLQIIFGTQSDNLKEEISRLVGSPLASIVASDYKPGYAATNDTRIRIIAPVSGKIIQLKELADSGFEQSSLGNGVAIQTSDALCLAPVAGKVTQLPSTEPALTIKTEDGYEVVIHSLTNTALLADQKYKFLIAKGQQIVVGQKIFETDSRNIATTDSLAIVSIVIPGMKEVEVTPAEEVTAGEDTILQFKRNNMVK
ncbi:PTS transporter subunit IIABC [Sporomusa sp.]|uniref:PTS transporter subunit IIABC n=1 Tax=Sporomusa sp. TaxID=2078658 RepID=UPI002CBCE0A2|nr:PTS transporter subunit EIIC [Sporomusa sp.]HWR43719.1 PTS transporter subunit EIIC [Sporomusa sp.]